ncbi:Hypothetical protein D9617_17g047030 [Elsinoe fawcettii]|nr:Hypothetical protein D9617_17g047030 [Elsinoe fawcettii]
MFVVVAILSILACVSHAISAIKEMDARDTTRHFSHIQTSEEATADYRDTEINPSQEDQAQKVVASPEQSQASASAMEQGLLTSAKETSYGTIDKGKRQALVNVDDEQ